MEFRVTGHPRVLTLGLKPLFLALGSSRTSHSPWMLRLLGSEKHLNDWAGEFLGFLSHDKPL